MDYSRIDPEALEMVAGARREQSAADEMGRAAAKRWREAARPLVRTNIRATCGDLCSRARA
ncbi:MAG: hypothetical protein ACRDTC_22095 [Pseudonocardiaceae bacterium]